RTAPYFGQDGKLMGYVGTLVDITENKRSKEALQLSEERFSKAFFSSPCPMAIVSLIDGRFITINKSFTQLIGYNINEVIGNTSLEINLWENSERRSKFLKDALEQGSVYDREVIFRTKSGLRLEGIHSGEVIELNGEQCLLSVFNDLTERKQMEKEMARLDRLSIVGEMAAGIAHEIRNPMTTVRGNLQLLGAKKENAHLKDYFSLMVSEIDRANSIITEYLTLAKDKATSKREKNINTILQTILPLIEADAAKDDKSIFTSLDKVPSLLMDDKEIRQLIINLARNGLEAMHPGGIMMIRTYKEGEEVVLAVEDQGRGISTEVMEKIGTPFFTTKDNGTGLGLAICYSIASRHNALIKIETSPQGSIFFVRFKASQGTEYKQVAATK
ncbi:MAG: ATP-binding protein, partial [Bacillota bacterium]